jgi:hypothetical protein
MPAWLHQKGQASLVLGARAEGNLFHQKTTGTCIWPRLFETSAVRVGQTIVRMEPWWMTCELMPIGNS